MKRLYVSIDGHDAFKGRANQVSNTPDVLRLQLGRFCSAMLSDLISTAIEILDDRDWDCDLELSGDEFDGSFQSEDEFRIHRRNPITGDWEIPLR